MRRYIFVFALFAVILAVGCGFELAIRLSAHIERAAFVVVPSVFAFSALIGLNTSKQ